MFPSVDTTAPREVSSSPPSEVRASSPAIISRKCSRKNPAARDTTVSRTLSVPSRIGMMARGVWVCWIDRSIIRPSTLMRITLMPPDVEPVQPPTTIRNSRTSCAPATQAT